MWTLRKQSASWPRVDVGRRIESVRLVFLTFELTAKSEILSALLRNEEEVLKVELLVSVFVSSANRTQPYSKMILDQPHGSQALQLVVKVVRIPTQEGATLLNSHKLVVFVLRHDSLQRDF